MREKIFDKEIIKGKNKYLVWKTVKVVHKKFLEKIKTKIKDGKFFTSQKTISEIWGKIEMESTFFDEISEKLILFLDIFGSKKASITELVEKIQILQDEINKQEEQIASKYNIYATEIENFEEKRKRYLKMSDNKSKNSQLMLQRDLK